MGPADRRSEAGWGAAAASALVLVGLLAACSPNGDRTGQAGDGSLDGELMVFAAASLTDVFDELVTLFVAAHPGVDVSVNLAGSQVLAAQLLAGASADVFAAADPTAMDRVVGDGLASAPEHFASNELVIVVERGNPLDIEGLGDLAREDVVLVLPADQAAAGRYAVEVLEGAGIEVSPASLEADPRAATTRVATGEADAAIVFRTDALAAAQRVDGVVIPAEQNATAHYPIAILDVAPNLEAGAAFVDLVLSAEGRAVFEAAGFTVPG
jgi:molybdate transport system substrate-binding protein